jgi:hypothetical protein
VRLQGGKHFTWTNAVCAGHPQMADRLARQTSAQLINEYGFAFLNQYLKQMLSSLLTGPGMGLPISRHEP